MNLKTFLTFLSRNKAYTAINVFGLSISLMFVMLIGMYVWQENRVDKQHAKAHRIYSVGVEIGGVKKIGSTRQLAPYMKSRYPEIEMTCAISVSSKQIVLPNGDLMQKPFLCADSTFFSMFDFEIIEGDRSRLLDSRQSCVLSQSFARLLFGEDSPIGRNLVLNDGGKLKITGVMADMEETSFKPCDVVCRMEMVSNTSLLTGLDNAAGASLYVMAKPGADLMAKLPDMDSYFKQFFWYYQYYDTKTFLQPLSEQYFSEVEEVNDNVIKGSRRLVQILFASGIVVLLFAVTNYINLTVAQAGRRSREMAMRRLLGCRRKGIVLRLIVESVLLCAVALVISLLLVVACSMLTDEVDLARSVTPLSITAIVFFTLLLGVAAGVFPAIVISRAKPIDVVRGTYAYRSKMRFSRVFIVIQNVITVVMITVALIMGWQTHHLINAPLGFNQDNIINIKWPRGDSLQHTTFVKEVQKLACVKKVSMSCGTPSTGGNNLTMQGADKKTYSFHYMYADENFFDIYGLKALKPNTDGAVAKVYVTDFTKRSMGKMFYEFNWKELFGRNMTAKGFGVLKDFRLQNIDKDMSLTIVYVIDRQWLASSPWNISILITGNQEEAVKQVRVIYKKIYHYEYTDEKPFVDQQVAANYQLEKILSFIVAMFALIAIVISLLGLVAMSTYFIQQRQKDIAVRKVFGSTNRQVYARLVSGFLGYVFIAYVIAVPIAWYFCSQWLSQFNYRIPLSPVIFLASGALCFTVCFLAVFIQSYQASNANPVIYLKDNN